MAAKATAATNDREWKFFNKIKKKKLQKFSFTHILDRSRDDDDERRKDLSFGQLA